MPPFFAVSPAGRFSREMIANQVEALYNTGKGLSIALVRKTA